MQTMKTLALCLAICMIALTGAMGAFANEQQPGSSIEHSIVDSNLGPMQLDPSGALAAAAADDLIAAESAQSPSAPDASDAQHKAFTSGQPLRQDPNHNQMPASVAPSHFVMSHPQAQAPVGPPQQQQVQPHPHAQPPMGAYLNAHQMAAMRQQQQQHQHPHAHPHNQKAANSPPGNPFNPFIAAALAGNYGQAQQQMAANYQQQQPRIMAAGASAMSGPHPAHLPMGAGPMQHPNQMLVQQQHHQQQQQQQAIVPSQHQNQHPLMQQASLTHPAGFPMRNNQEAGISMAESTLRQNVVPAPAAAPQAQNVHMNNEVGGTDPNEMASLQDTAPAASSTSTAVVQASGQGLSSASSALAASSGSGGVGTSSQVNGPSTSSASQQQQAWPLAAPDVPKITNLEVKCEKNLMKVSIEFDKFFNGVIFSKGHYSQNQCVHVAQNSGKQQAYFDISINSCGTAGNTQNGLYGMGGNTGSGTYFENTIVIQYDPNVQEVYDHARKLRCTWHDQYEKAVTFRPFPVDMLDIVRADFAGDNVGCWMQIQVGKGPWASEVAGIVKIGQTMTMVLAIKDEENKFDMLVRNCFAHDGKRGPIELVDKTGCITRPKLMSRFTKIKNFGSSATVLSYAHFQAFKFPDSMEVHFQCTIQICRHQCPEQCSASGSSSNDNSYTESTIHGTMNIHDRQGGGAEPSMRKFGSQSGGGLIREKRHANETTTTTGSSLAKRLESKMNRMMIGVNRVIQVVSTGDLAFAIQQQFQQTNRSLNDQQQQQQEKKQQPAESAENIALESSARQTMELVNGNQICMSSYNFVLSLVVLCLMLLSSCLCAISLYWRQQCFSSSSSSSSSSSCSSSSKSSLLSCSPPPAITTNCRRTSSPNKSINHHNNQLIKNNNDNNNHHMTSSSLHHHINNNLVPSLNQNKNMLFDGQQH